MEVDPELVRAVQRGDAGAVDALVRATYADVYRRCLRLLGDPADAADATQEIYVRVVRSVLGFRAESSFGTWLHRITVNVCATAMRRRGDARARGQQAGVTSFGGPGDADGAIAAGSDPEAELLDRAGSELLRGALDRLPPAARDVVVLRDLEGLSTRETARVLGVSESVVKVRLHRAHAKLRGLVSAATTDGSDLP